MSLLNIGGVESGVVQWFFVMWIELQQKEKKKIEKSRCTERNGEKRWKEKFPDSQEPPSFPFDSFWRLSSISTIGFWELLLTLYFVVICLFYPFFTHYCIWRTSVAANILGLTWSCNQIDLTFNYTVTGGTSWILCVGISHFSSNKGKEWILRSKRDDCAGCLLFALPNLFLTLLSLYRTNLYGPK